MGDDERDATRAGNANKNGDAKVKATSTNAQEEGVEAARDRQQLLHARTALHVVPRLHLPSNDTNERDVKEHESVSQHVSEHESGDAKDDRRAAWRRKRKGAGSISQQGSQPRECRHTSRSRKTTTVKRKVGRSEKERTCRRSWW